MLDRSTSRQNATAVDAKLQITTFETIHSIMTRLPEAREPLSHAFKYCSRTNPAALRFIMSLMSIYLHVGPFSRKVMADIDRQIADADMTPMPNTRVPMHLERAALSA